MRSAWLILPALLGAAAGPPASRDAPTFPIETRVVALDVVATGPDGRPVDDLRQDELQVLENGRPCETRSFRLIRANPSRDRTAAGDATATRKGYFATVRPSPSVAEEKPPLRVTPDDPARAEIGEGQPATSDASLVPILERAARYVVDYEESFRNVIAEEAYSQSVFVGTAVRAR